MPSQIVFLDRETLDRGDVDFSALAGLGELEMYPITPRSERAARVQSAEIVMTNKVEIDGPVMDAAPNLQLIQVVATGVNNVDLEAARQREIAVCNVSGYSTPAVVQHTFALILNLATNVHRYGNEPEKWAESPHFTRLDYPVTELAGKTLGIAGLGAIGGEVARVGEAFGMKIIGLGREGSQGREGEWPRVPRSEFFAESDVISLHCPLTPETQDLINADTLSQMKSSAFLINTGRGDLVVESDLIDALKTGSIAGAGLDVISAEPPGADHPILEQGIPNLLVTPHSAWSSRESRLRLLDGVVENIRAFQAGESRNRVV